MNGSIPNWKGQPVLGPRGGLPHRTGGPGSLEGLKNLNSYVKTPVYKTCQLILKKNKNINSEAGCVPKCDCRQMVGYFCSAMSSFLSFFHILGFEHIFLSHTGV